MFRFRLSKVLVLICTLLLSLSVSAGAKSITVAIDTARSDRAELMSDYLKWYQEHHGEIDVTYINFSSQFVLNLVAAGTPPEIQRVGAATLSEFADLGILADIGASLSQRGVTLDPFFPGVAHGTYYKGVLHALPSNVNMEVIYWNPDLFAAAGIAPPPVHYGSPEWTWTHVRETARRLTRYNSDGQIVSWGFEGNQQPIGNFEKMGTAWGARWLDENFNYVGDSPQMEQAIEFFADWHLSDRTMTLESNRFANGQAAMMIGHVADLPSHIRNVPLALAPGPTGHVPTLIGNGFRFFAGTDVEAALDFAIPLAYDPYWASIKAEAFGGVPSLRDALPVYAEMTPYLTDEMLQTFIDTMSVGELRGPDMGPHRAGINRIVSNYLGSSMNGRISAREALVHISTEVRGLLSR